MEYLGSTTVADFREDALSIQTENADGLMAGDKILKINGKKVHVYYDMKYKIMRYGTEPINITVLRTEQEVELNGVIFPTTEQQGVLFGKMDFLVLRAEKTVGSVLKTSFYQSVYTVRTVLDSLYDLFISRKYGLEQVSGPVGITEIITNEAQTAAKEKDNSRLWSLFIMLAINLGTMNLIPFPALDGGRLVFLIIEGIRRKPLDPKIEGYIHGIGMMLLMLLMFVVIFKDIFMLFQ
jgi:regulator of sigma E protease